MAESTEKVDTIVAESEEKAIEKTEEETEEVVDGEVEEEEETPEKSAKANCCYVGNLSWGVTSEDLSAHMASTGCSVVKADVLRQNGNGRSKGCGLVEFASEEDASKAILTLNDTDLMGRSIFVREDREEKKSGAGRTKAVGSTNKGASPSAEAPAGGSGRRLYVGNLAYSVKWQTLKDFFRQAGNVVYAEVMTEANGRSKGCGIVEFETAEEAEEAKKLTDTELNGRGIFVREDRETPKPHGGSSGTSVYIGNLSYETSWQDLKDHMRAAGNVDKADIITGSDGRSRGCGVVIYQKPQEAARAIRELHNSTLNGRPIFVREDREQGGSGGGYRSNKSGKSKGCQLFVQNLSYDTTWRDLKDHFRQCGDVEHVDVLEYPDGRKKGCGTVRFYQAEDAKEALETLDGVELMGRDLAIKIDHKA